MVRKKKIVIASVAKNVKTSFKLDFLRVLKAFADFEIVKWIIVESNSQDDSFSFMRKISQTESVLQIETITVNSENLQSRTQILAEARNRYLQLFYELPDRNEIDYLVVYDLNNLNKKLTQKAINSCWEFDGWGATTANQIGPYYDIWALRHKFWNNVDCWESHREMSEILGSSKLALWNSVYLKMIRIPRKSNWIKVDSAFGGIAMYDTKYIKNCVYLGTTSIGNQICEHISFNKGVRDNGGEIFINPSFINFRFTDHNLRRFYYLLWNFPTIMRNLVTGRSS
jgi:hypothetical protein